MYTLNVKGKLYIQLIKITLFVDYVQKFVIELTMKVCQV